MKKLFLPIAFLSLLFFASSAKAQTIWASNLTGNEKTTFYTNETVYLTSNNISIASISVRVYIVNDNNSWVNGTVLNDVRPGGYTEKSTNSTGYFNSEPIWTTPAVGKYDIVVDVNKDGFYNNSYSFGTNDYVYRFTSTGFEVFITPYPTLTVILGSSTPANHNWNASDASDNVMAQIRVVAGSYEAVKINSVGLIASGTGDDKAGVSVIRLILDSNSNGIYDSGESLIGYGQYVKDNSFATIDIQSGYTLPASSNFSMLVAYTMSNSPSSGETFSFKVASMTAVGSSSGQSATVNGLPLSSATKTVISSAATTSTTVQATTSTIPATTTTEAVTTSTIPATTTTIQNQESKSNYMMIAIVLTVAVIVGVILFLFFRTRVPSQSYDYERLKEKWK